MSFKVWMMGRSKARRVVYGYEFSEASGVYGIDDLGYRYGYKYRIQEHSHGRGQAIITALPWVEGPYDLSV